MRRLITAAILLTAAAVAFVSGYAYEAGKAAARYTARYMLEIQKRAGAPDDLPDLSHEDFSDAWAFVQRDDAIRAEFRAKANPDPEIAARSAAMLSHAAPSSPKGVRKN
jgi:hypothetical protein